MLADDLETMAVGYKHASKMRRDGTMVAGHCGAMVSKVSTGPGKSHSFASSKVARRILRKQLASAGRGILMHLRGLGGPRQHLQQA